MKSKLKHYCQIWGVQHPHKLADRPTSQVYQVDYEGHFAVLKVLTPIGVEDERHGATALACWGGDGAAHMYHADGGAHLLEYIDGEDCVSLVRDGRDDEASAVIGETLARLHRAHPKPPPRALTSLEDRFSELFVAAAEPGANPLFLRGAELARALLDAPLNTAVLHGDLHHENILRSSTRGWLAIDAKGLRGETTYDGAMAVLNPMNAGVTIDAPDRIQRIISILAAKMDVSPDRLTRFTFAHACLSASWLLETDTFSSNRALQIAQVIEGLIGPGS
ncbi:MAG: aminoglycoside phosphotransferase family protein [Pseudomonadota bacterium]